MADGYAVLVLYLLGAAEEWRWMRSHPWLDTLIRTQTVGEPEFTHNAVSVGARLVIAALWPLMAVWLLGRRLFANRERHA